MPELTPELIVDQANLSEPDLSPDGATAVYVVRASGKREEHPTSALWIAPSDGSAEPRPFTAGLAEDRRPRWAPDGRSVAFLSDRAKRGTAQLYLIPVNGGEARPLQAKPGSRPVLDFAWSPDGTRIAFSSADEPTEEEQRREKERDDPDVWGERWQFARLRLLDLATGEISTVVALDRHVAGFAWSPDGTQLAYVTQETPEIDTMAAPATIERVALADHEPRLVCRLPSVPFNFRWSARGELLIFTASTDQQPQSAFSVWAVPASGGTARRIAFGETSCGLLGDVPSGAGRAVALEAAGLASFLRWLDPTTGAVTPLYPPAGSDPAEGDFWSAAVQAPKEKRLAIALVYSQGNRPAEIWAGQTDSLDDGPHLRPVSRHNLALSEIDYGTQEPFFWTAPDGWELDGLLLRPPGAPTDRPLPTIVLIHGGPYWRWTNGIQLSWANWGQWLATAGYAVLMPNPRGGMGHGERFAAAARADVGGADYRDVMAAVDAAIARGITDPERLGIGGWSQGGFMTAWAVTQTRRFKVGVMGAGVSDWGMMVLTGDVPQFERSLGGSVPWDGPGPHRHVELSPIAFARNVTTPVLLLHGQNDLRVPVSQAIGFHRALRDVGVPTELVVYPREPHGISERAHQIDVLRRVRAWFNRWLKPSDE
jgi:dipeptidyl aminopeptidase/acylaminoacyl peptidase